MSVTELSEEYRRFLDDVTPALQENLVRAFRNEALRTQRRKNFLRSVHQLDAVLISLQDTKIELSELLLAWLPDFRIAKFTVDLPRLCLDVHFKLGNLRVEGVYDVNNLALQKLLPVSHTGKVVVTFSEVELRGRIGLLIQGDSFVPGNYDVDYNWSETEVSARYYVSNDVQVENKITSLNGEQIIGDTIWFQLNGLVTELLHEQLSSVIFGFSVEECLEHKDQDLRILAKNTSSRANRLFDLLLCSAKDYLVERNYWAVETPPFDVIYRGKISSLEQGIFQTGKGYLQDLSTLSRLRDLSLYEDELKVVVYGSIGLREFKHGYELFSSKFEGTEVNGSIRTSIYKNTIFLRLSYDKTDELSKTRLEKVRTRSVGDIDVDSSGLASLSWLVPKIRSWVIGHLRSRAIPVLERYIEEAFNHAIELEWKKAQKAVTQEEESSVFWRSVFVGGFHT